MATIFNHVFQPQARRPRHAPEAKAEYDGRAGKIKNYLRFNPDEIVFALGNAGMVRLHAGAARLVAGQGWIYRGGDARELMLGADIPEMGPKR